MLQGTKDKGEDKSCLSVAVSDGEVCQLAKVYDMKHFLRFSVGTSLVLRDVIRRTDEGGYLVVTKFTKVFVTSGVEVPSAHEEMGVILLNPPPAQQVTLTEALNSPQKKRISVTGMILQEEAVKTVNVRGEDVPIKVIVLEDASKKKAKVSLWRDASMTPTRPGDFVAVTDVVTNQYRGETSLSTTNRTKVEKMETPVTRSRVKVVGVSVDGPSADLLLEDDNILTVSSELLINIVPAGTDIEALSADGPIEMTVETKASEVINIEM